jgi:hypothetical protein
VSAPTADAALTDAVRELGGRLRPGDEGEKRAAALGVLRLASRLVADVPSDGSREE